MRVLLDTVAFIFLITDDDRLPPAARDVLFNNDNDLLLSVASVWELAIKAAGGKFHFGQPIQSLIPGLLTRYGIAPIAIELEDVLEVAELPAIHKDPFDRMIIAQALRRKLPLVTADSVFGRYGAAVIW